MERSFYINYEDEYAVNKLENYFSRLVLKTKKKYQDIIFICIGTDRSTGDSLAPFVGYKLQNKYKVYGTIHNPVHAKNLEEVMNKIDIKNNLIIAIDASLGTNVGYISVNRGSIKPGAGVGKTHLNEVGDISIAGIVNYSGFMDFMVLQNTRLSLVIKMSEIIAKAIDNSMRQIKKKSLYIK